MSRTTLGLIVMLAVGSSGLAVAKPGRPDKRVATQEEQVVTLLNRFRSEAGVAPVELDATASKGCMEHARYMLLNKDTPAMVGLNAHKQDPKLPGATPAGAACGKAADLFPGVSDLTSAVNGWMASLYHRRPMLAPGLAKVGVGYAALPDGSLMAALMFVDAKGPGEGWPIAYPPRDLTDVPLEFGNEIPNPIPNDGSGGYPITLQYPPFDKVEDVKVTLVDGKQRAVPFYLSTPEQPATTFGQYGVICVIPKQTLRPETRYQVTITATWKGKPETRTWAFTTIALRKVDANDETALLGALGQASLVRGTVLYGGMMNAATVFLQIGKSEGGRYTMVSVLIPIAAWRELAGKAEPSSVKGKPVEVEATPRLVQNKYLNLPITLASQLRFTKP